MNVKLGPHWEKFVESAVRQGRYGSASEVVQEGLRLVEEREARRVALRETLNRSIAAGGDLREDDLNAALEARAAELSREGY